MAPDLSVDLNERDFRCIACILILVEGCWGPHMGHTKIAHSGSVVSEHL